MHLNHQGAFYFAKQAGQKPVDLSKWKDNNIVQLKQSFQLKVKAYPI